MKSHLDGKNSIITGASRGIGLKAAHALSRRGGRVALFGRDEAALQAGATAVGNGAIYFVVDIENATALKSTIDRAAQALGGLDGIINNAGVSLMNKVEHLVEARVSHQVNVNFLAQVYGCQAAIPHLRRRGGGRIVNVSSVTVRALDEFTQIAIYSATKAAVERFTLELRREVKPDNIGVTLFSPGSTSTAFGSGQDPAIMEAAFKEWLDRAEYYDGTLSAEEAGEAMIASIDIPDGTNFDLVEFNPNRPTPRRQTLEDYGDRGNNP
jgi:NAD(P)-dependent dehydrogenase (short-subunit alcohol dehydrogenase family)